MDRRKPAFTILELLVVIAIMGMLISIAIPSLSAARRHAKANACLSGLKGIGTGFTVYLNENDDQFPPYRLDRVPPTAEEDYVNESGRRAPRWQWFIETEMGPVINPFPYRWKIESAGYFDDETPARPEMTPGTRMSNSVFTCPSLVDDEFALNIRDGAYGYNYQYLGNTRQERTPGRWDNYSVGLHRIRNAGQTIVLADSRGADRTHGRHSFTLDPPRLAIEVNAMSFGPSESDISPRDAKATYRDYPIFQYSPVEMRHGGQGNILFVDNHANAMTLVELGYEMSDRVEIEEEQTVPKGTAIPIIDPESEGYTATNRLWNGDGIDDIARQHNPETP